MILEGFEIENWSCIKRVAVDGLPPTGVIVLCGPNGTGKSSILEALRACMMDNKSTSKALGRGFPKNSSDRPRVTVTFRAKGTTWRIMKQFNSKESKLESRTPTGHWKLETTDQTEAHERTRQLAGGCDSSLGLHQLLWLTQAEFRLPDPKKFDTDVQSRLRAVLGVLQTPLDDRFLGRVKDEWSRWFSAHSKPGEKPKLKKDCPLDKKRLELARQKTELAEIDREYQSLEDRMERSANLEVRSRDLSRQVIEKTAARDLLREEYERSLTRLKANELAVERVTGAEKFWKDQHNQREQRADLEERIHGTERTAETADRDVEEASLQLQSAEERLRAKRRDIHSLMDTGRGLQAQLNQVGELQRWLTLKEEAKAKRENLRRAEHTASELEELKKQARERPAPDAVTIRKLEQNRASAARLRADLEAAAIALSLVPNPGVATPSLAIDGAQPVEAGPMADGLPILRLVRRRAEIVVPGWGRVELTRGSDARSLDQIEHDLNDLDSQFAEALAPYGVPASDPTALDQLRNLAAEKTVRDPDLKNKQGELDRLARDGLDTLREEVAQIERRQEASESELKSQPEHAELPQDPTELDRLATKLKKDIDANKSDVTALEKEIERLEHEIEGKRDAVPVGGKRSVDRNEDKTTASGLRQKEAVAKERLATLKAKTAALREELKRFPTAERIEAAVREASESLDRARAELEAAKLSESEMTIRERLDATNDGLKALEKQLSATDKELHEIKGAMSQTEGLHQRRAAAATRVEELTRQTERETLESEAYDRLYALFEECREKQLGLLMDPIHDRVLRWMRLLRIGDYQSIRFNDQFLPDSLIAGDGATELMLGEESTGTIEQIALMVRLALGSTLSSSEEPVVAMLDDPLSHSDVVRLDRMRAVLKDASAGVPGLTPPAGPLQVVVFTCRPEWFIFDGATFIDLSKPDVLSKRC
jgi:energy-coupling factor transporter ATP-binding protein EcfA2